MNLSIDVLKESDRETSLAIKGEIDVYTAPKFREELLPLCERENHKVTVDLSEISYIDSMGVGVFIGAYKAAQTSGSEIRLTSMTPRVVRLFKITGLNELMTIDQTPKDRRTITNGG